MFYLPSSNVWIHFWVETKGIFRLINVATKSYVYVPVHIPVYVYVFNIKYIFLKNMLSYWKYS